VKSYIVEYVLIHSGKSTQEFIVQLARWLLLDQGGHWRQHHAVKKDMETDVRRPTSSYFCSSDI